MHAYFFAMIFLTSPPIGSLIGDQGSVDRARQWGSEDVKAVARDLPPESDGTDAGANERRKGRRRSKTIALRRLTRDEIRQGIELADMMGYRRPHSRSECRDGPRPCPFVACKHHLYLDVNPDTGSIKLNFPDIDVGDMAETCALDIADRGGITLEEVGDILNLTRERIRQVEVMGLEKLRETGFALELDGVKVVDDG